VADADCTAERAERGARAASGTTSSGIRAHAAPDEEISAATPEPEREHQPEGAADECAQRDLLGEQEGRARARAQQARQHVLVPLQRQHAAPSSSVTNASEMARP